MSKSGQAVIMAEEEHNNNNGVHSEVTGLAYWCMICQRERKENKTMREAVMEVYPEKFKNMNFTVSVDVPEPECEFGHICDSTCENSKPCPCNDSHYCSMSDHDISECMGSDDGVCQKHWKDVPEPDHKETDTYNDEAFDTRRDNESNVPNFIN